MFAKILFIITLVAAVVLSVVAFAPNSDSIRFTLQRLLNKIGIGSQEESKNPLIKERQKLLERRITDTPRSLQQKNLKEKYEDLKQEQKILMENRKDQAQQFKDSSQRQSIDPSELRQKERQQAETVQQEKERLKENQQTEQERQKELKDAQDRQRMALRDRMNDMRDRMNSR